MSLWDMVAGRLRLKIKWISADGQSWQTQEGELFGDSPSVTMILPEGKGIVVASLERAAETQEAGQK